MKYFRYFVILIENTHTMPLKRRAFLQKSALAGSGLFLGSNTYLREDNKPNFDIPADFSLTILATNWGFKGDYDAFCAKAKESAYDGIEVWLPRTQEQRAALMEAIQKYDLKYGFLAAGGRSDFEKHFSSFQQAVQDTVALKPLFVNCHSGKDFFTFEENKQFIEFTIELGKSSGVPIYHETHRGRILFNAPLAKKFMDILPELRLTLDISHWCNVHESFLQDQPDAVDLALSRTDHIHSRVGHPESPQVSDFRAPEWSTALKVHLDWWDRVVKQKIKEDKGLTMTAEFGPPPYMPALPYTKQPVVDLWELNTAMMQLWRERYSA